MTPDMMTDNLDRAQDTIARLTAERDEAQTDLAKVIMALPTGKGERAVGAVGGVKMLRSRLEAERDAAVAEADSWKNRALHQNEVANTAEARAEAAETAAEFFKGEVKLRNRIPSTNDTNADLLRRAEKAEAELTAANARAEHSEKLLCRLLNASPVFNRDSLYQDMKEEILTSDDEGME